MGSSDVFTTTYSAEVRVTSRITKFNSYEGGPKGAVGVDQDLLTVTVSASDLDKLKERVFNVLAAGI